MRYLIFISILIYNNLFAQMLLENKDGDPLFIPLISLNSGTNYDAALIKINTGDQSLGFNYYNFEDMLTTTNSYHFWSLGAKLKPTEGYAAVFKNGQFSPGLKISFTVSQVKLFNTNSDTTKSNILDWGSLYINYSRDKYLLFRADTTFKNQIYNTSFDGLGLGLNYNILIKSTYLLSIIFGYQKNNNFSNLDQAEVKDVKNEFDSLSNTFRQIEITKSVHQGKYAEFDSYPLNISFTKLTPDNESVSIGYNIYLSVSPSSMVKPKCNIGYILYLAQLKDGISVPVLGFIFQIDDFFDVQKLNNDILKRLSVGLSSKFSIF